MNEKINEIIYITAYQYRNLLGRILLLAKIMIIVNKYKYEFQKNSK